MLFGNGVKGSALWIVKVFKSRMAHRRLDVRVCQSRGLRQPGPHKKVSRSEGSCRSTRNGRTYSVRWGNKIISVSMIMYQVGQPIKSLRQTFTEE